MHITFVMRDNWALGNNFVIDTRELRANSLLQIKFNMDLYHHKI